MLKKRKGKKIFRRKRKKVVEPPITRELSTTVSYPDEDITYVVRISEYAKPDPVIMPHHRMALEVLKPMEMTTSEGNYSYLHRLYHVSLPMPLWGSLLNDLLEVFKQINSKHSKLRKKRRR